MNIHFVVSTWDIHFYPAVGFWNMAEKLFRIRIILQSSSRGSLMCNILVTSSGLWDIRKWGLVVRKNLVLYMHWFPLIISNSVFSFSGVTMSKSKPPCYFWHYIQWALFTIYLFIFLDVQKIMVFLKKKKKTY